MHATKRNDRDRSTDCDVRTSGTLVQAIQQMDDCASWHRFVQMYEPMMRDWLKFNGLSAEASEDIVGEVYCKLVSNLPKFVYDPSRSFRGWLRVMVDNAAIDALRRESRKNQTLLELQQSIPNSPVMHSTPGPVDTLEELSESVEQRLKFAHLVVNDVRGRVASSTWDAFFLKEIEGWSGDHVAEHLGIPVQNVYVHAFRVRKMLGDTRDRLVKQLPQEAP